jgi:hypothetical protein
MVLQVLQQDASNLEFNEQQTAGAIQTVDNAPLLIFSALNELDLSPGASKALESALVVRFAYGYHGRKVGQIVA